MKQRLLMGVGVAAVIIGGLFVLSYVKDSRFHIVKTAPSLSQISTATSSLNITFNKNLSNKVTIQSSSSIVNNYSVNGKTLHIVWSAVLLPAKKYSFTLTSISATDGETIKNKVITFTVNYTSDLSPAQQNEAVKNQDNVTPADKIYGLLPYYSTYYTLEAQPNGQSKPSIAFSYLPPPSYLPSDQTAGAPSEQQALEEAKAWLSSHGIDVNSYQFTINSN